MRQKILRESGKRRAGKSTQIALFFENGDIVRHMKKKVAWGLESSRMAKLFFSDMDLSW